MKTRLFKIKGNDAQTIQVKLFSTCDGEHPFNEIAFKEKIIANLASGTRAPLETHLNNIRIMQYFLILLTGSNTPIEHCYGFIHSGRQSQDIEILFRQINYDRPEHIHNLDFNVPFPEIRSKLRKILERWFRSFARLEETYNLYFGTFFNQTQYLNSTFLNLTQALENYHRVCSPGGNYMNEQEYAMHVLPKLLAAIPERLDNDHRTSLKSRMKYGNEISMRRRVKDILNSLPSGLQKTFFDGDTGSASNRLVRLVVDTRNYYTHLSMDGDATVSDYISLLLLNDTLRTLLTILLLKNLVIDEELLTTRFPEIHRHKHGFRAYERINLRKQDPEK